MTKKMAIDYSNKYLDDNANFNYKKKEGMSRQIFATQNASYCPQKYCMTN